MKNNIRIKIKTGQSKHGIWPNLFPVTSLSRDILIYPKNESLNWFFTIKASDPLGYVCVGVTRVLKTVRNLESDVMKIGMKKIYKFLVMFEIISKPPIIKLNPPHQWTIHNFRNKYLNPQSIVRLLVLLPWILGPFRGPYNLWTGNGPSERPGK